ncbi:MAG: valine--tRNA ligase [Candidatus Diapherotrites archaeon]|nr:valine--tRNA ligase [Candidatus Diapherotrites archaeon]
MPKYNPFEIEKKWQDKWIEDGIYKFDINAPGEVYAIDNPPSFTSGTLHMGHILNHSWIDFIARYKRMRGYNVLFPLGYDCHGLPTELRVAKEYGIPKENRKEFREKCEEWTTQAIKRMNEQYKSIGYSCDWNEYYETRMPKYKKAVQYSLIKFFEMGRIYREKHPVLWCTKCGTALAKAEVGYKEEKGKLWYLRFPIVGKDRHIEIATTRPELMFACVAVFVHPDDERYYGLAGSKVLIPYVNREVPILTDEEVDREFGTGAVYLCTFGDEMDIKWQKEYNLPVYVAIDKTGRMTELCGKYKGMTTKQCREELLKDLKNDGYLVKEEDYIHNVLAHTERSACMNPVEFLPMEQWFIKLKDKLDDVIDAANQMQWYPAYMKQRLVDWATSLDWDWIISRQRVYGTPIPFWYCEKCGKIYPARVDQLPVDPLVDKPPVEKCECGNPLKGAEDTCDCWVDSSITPLMVAHWLEDDGYFEKAYPNYLRPQGYEIIRTWAFYTIFRDLLLTGKPPFKHVVVNGMVAGTDGRKMAKSFGNVIEPEEVISKEGADAIRQWALNASLGEDYPFSWKEITHGAKFQKKYWNASYFASQFLKDYKPEEPEQLRPVDRWILSKLNKLIKHSTEVLDRYEFAKALTPIRDFFWHDFCDNYIEMAKARLYNGTEEERKAAQYCLYEVLLKTSLMLAPFIPHITEEIHELYLKQFTKSKSIHLMKWPEYNEKFFNDEIESKANKAIAVISAVRKFKNENKMPLNAEITKLVIYEKPIQEFEKDIQETVKAKTIEFSDGKGNIECELDITIDIEK